jgi:hypothetical protein
VRDEFPLTLSVAMGYDSDLWDGTIVVRGDLTMKLRFRFWRQHRRGQALAAPKALEPGTVRRPWLSVENTDLEDGARLTEPATAARLSPHNTRARYAVGM